MNLYTYYENGTWKAFEAESLPVKPDELSRANFIDVCSCDDCEPVREYNHKISELKAKALPVFNPEIIDERMYTWPGKWERGYAVYILTLPNMEKIELHATDSGKLYIKPEDLFVQDKVQEVIKKAAMKSETSKKIQDETPQERIEREAEGLSRIRVWPEQMRVTFKNGYIAGATAELQRYELERTEMYNKYNEAKQEIANHKAINSLLLDSDDEVRLANEVFRLRESLKELLTTAQEVFNSITIDDAETHRKYQILADRIHKAENLLNEKP